MDDAKLKAGLKEMIVRCARLSVAPDSIGDDQLLFDTEHGLGLDSIDALELALEISQRFGFEMRADDEENQRIFASLRNLAEHIESNRVK